MAVTAKFEADFGQFQTAVDSAIVKFRGFEAGSASVERQLNKMVDAFSGRKVVTEATLMAQAMERVGGASKFTEAELRRMGAVGEEAANKLRALGKDVPKGIQDLATHANSATTSVGGLSSVMKGLSIESVLTNPLGTAKTAAFGFAESIGGVTLAAAASVAAIAAIGAAAFKLASNAAAVGAGLDDMADKTSMSVPALSRLQNAAKVAGSDLGTLTNAVFMVEQRMGEGGKKWDAAMAKMGLSTQQLREAGPDKLLDVLAAGLAGIADPADRAAAGAAVMGKGFKDVAPVLADLNAAFELTNDIEPWTAEQAAEAEAFEMQMSSLLVHAEAFGMSVGRWLIGPIGSFIGVTVDAVTWLGKMGGELTGILPLIRGIGSAWEFSTAAIRTFKGVAETLPKITGDAAAGVSKWQKSVEGMAATVPDLTAALIEEEFASTGLARDLTALEKAHTAAEAAAKKQATEIARLAKEEREIYGHIHKTTYDMAQQHVKQWRDESLKAAADVNKGIIANIQDQQKYRRQHDDAVRKLSLNSFNFQRSQVEQWAADERKILEARGGDWSRAWAGVQQSATDALEVIRRAEEEAFKIGGPQFQGPLQEQIDKFEDFDSQLHKVAKSFEQLANIAGDSFGGIVKDIAQVVGAMDLGAQAAKQFNDALSKRDAGGMAVGFAGMVGAMDQATNSTSRFQATLGGAATGMKIGASVAGPYGAVVGAAAGALVGWIRSAGAAERAINPLRQQFVDLNGGLAALDKKAHDAGVTLTAMLNAKNPEQYKKALDELTAALDLQDNAMATLDATVQKYGFSIEELGPKFAAQKLHEQAGVLLQDYSVLTAAGVDHEAIIKKMGPALQEYVNKSRETKTAIPENMRPILESMVKLGQLTDASGDKMTDLEGLTFTETLDAKFGKLVDTINKLVDAISRGLGNAIKNVPDVEVDVHYNIPKMPIQEFANGGVVLPFQARGTDTVPAMLTPGEVVLNRTQQNNLLNGGGGNAALVASLDAFREEMAADRRREQAYRTAELQRIIKATVQTAGGRR